MNTTTPPTAATPKIEPKIIQNTTVELFFFASVVVSVASPLVDVVTSWSISFATKYPSESKWKSTVLISAIEDGTNEILPFSSCVISSPSTVNAV